MAELPSASFYYVTKVKLSGTAEQEVRFSVPVSRIDIFTAADDIEFELILENVMREPFISISASSFYSIDAQADLIKIRGTAPGASSTVQVVGWVF